MIAALNDAAASSKASAISTWVNRLVLRIAAAPGAPEGCGPRGVQSVCHRPATRGPDDRKAKTNLMKRLLSCVLVAFFVGCGSKPLTPTPVPTPTPIPACQANSTATISFRNTAPSSTHTVLLDGATVATLAPGQESQRFTVAAGVAHTVEFRVTNTTRRACATTQPVWAVCSNGTLACGND